MKHYYLAAICLYCCLIKSEICFSQNPSPCGTDYWRAKTLQDPEFAQKYQEYEQGIYQVFEQKKTSSGPAEQTKVIPVVIHIIHDGGAENISDVQAQQAIIWLNQALSNQGTFNQGSGADCGIQLCLAQRTPDNQVSNGITRNQSTLTEMQMETQDLQVKNLNRWKPTEYLNIWLVRSICSTTYGCGVYGYANYPYAHGSNMDGIMIEAAYLTQITKVTGLAHEVGHYLGLYHTFEGGCTNNNCLLDGDRICDTPPDQSTAGVPCSDQVNTCATDTQSGPFGTDQPDMSWNFLDYGIIACFHDFTPDQSTRMNATLDGTRKSLLSSKGCLPPCPGLTVANFTPSASSATVGQTINFTNTSLNANGFTWTLNGVPFSTQANASYTFTMPGIYTVALTAQPTNSSLCEPDVKQISIQVNCDITASFSASTLSAEINAPIALTNTSQNALQWEWFINGLSQGSTLDTLRFNQAGVYEITLETGNGVCRDTATVLIYVQGVCLQKTFDAYVTTSYSVINGKSDITPITDGDLLIAGIGSSVLTGNQSPVFVKMKADGQIIWAKEFGYDSTNVPVIAVRATPDGGFVALFEEDHFSQTNIVQKFYLAKFSANGMVSWAQKIHESNNLFPNAFLDVWIIVNTDGSILISAPFLTKFSSTGALIWTKNQTKLGQLAPYPDGGFLGVELNAVLRFDEMGNLIWRRVIEASTYIETRNVIAMPDGNIFVSGCATGTQLGFCQGLLLKLNPEGETIWAKQYRQVPVSTYQFECMTGTANGNLAIAGYATADDPGPGNFKPYHLMLELDLDGNIIWKRHRSKWFHSNEITCLPGAGYVVVGDGLRVLKTDPLGQTIECPENPHEILTFDLSVTNTPGNIAIEDTTLLIMPIALPGTDLPWLIDTLCAPACQYSTEICNNNVDDDGDGLFDCLDPDCNCTEFKCSPKQGNRWYFGKHAGMDFNTDPPTALGNGGFENHGISASICDVKGNLLFYTDGDTVFNRFHQIMPNGIFPNTSWAYQCQIIPHPGNASLYYILVNYPGGLIYYSIVDMTLDNGRGDIVPSQKHQLLTSLSSGLAVVKACSFKGYWILCRTLSQESKFRAFRLDENGLNNLTPVESNSGQDVGAVRQLKFSPDGRYVACTYVSISNFDTSYVSLYRFDPYNGGMVFNPMIIGMYRTPREAFGVEFSPNGRFLYVSGNFPGNSQMLQFDLEAGNLADIQNSETKLVNIPGQSIGYMQLGPNGKIYAPTWPNINPTSYYLEVIHKPDQPGTNCQFQHNGFDLSNAVPFGNSWEGLCNAISSDLVAPHIAFPANAADTICQLNTPIQYQIPTVQCGIDSIVWQTQNLDAQIQPNYQYATIRYLQPGSGQLIITAYTPCGISSDTLEVLVATPITKILDLGPDLVVCQNGVYRFNAGSGFARYQWSDGTADSTTTTLFPGKYWVNVWDLCGNRQTDTITVSIAPNSVLNLGPDLPQQCSGYSVTYQRPAIFESWQWSPGDFLNCTDCPDVTLSPQNSFAWTVVAQTADGCVSVDTLYATIRDTLLFSRDTTVCIGETLSIFGVSLPADTSAQFFFPSAGIGCDSLLNINVLGLGNSSSAVSVTICPNGFYNFHGILLPADTIATFHFSSAIACDSAVTVSVYSFPDLDLRLPMDTSIRIGASVLLETQTSANGALDFAWSPSEGLSCVACPDPIAQPLDTITYTLAVTDANGCTSQGSVTVRVSEECRVRIPNVFTPNGDGFNDLFRPVLDPCVRKVRYWRILNRWGETVFTQVNLAANDPILGWDGSREGRPHPSDVLIWVAEFEYYDGRTDTMKGEVTLVR